MRKKDSKIIPKKKRINSKRKGSVGELELVDFLKELGLNARRTAQFCGKSGDAADVICEELPWVHFECKRVETLSLYVALEQAKRDSAGGEKLPIVAHRRSRKDWVAILDLAEFVKLARSYLRSA